jgi:hypothetical protein
MLYECNFGWWCNIGRWITVINFKYVNLFRLTANLSQANRQLKSELAFHRKQYVQVLFISTGNT